MAIENYNHPISETIEKILKSKGYKQSAIAQMAGFEVRVFNDMLNGRRIIKACDIPSIATALGVTPNELYGINMKNDKAS